MKRYLLFLASLALAQEPSFGFDDPQPAEAPSADLAFSSPILEWKGEVSMRTRSFYLAKEHWNNFLSALPEARLNLSGTSGAAQMKVNLSVNPEILADDPVSVLAESWVRLNGGDYFWEAGLLKPAWGRADALRVVDVLTPLDRRDFIHPDIIDQKMAQPMLRLVWQPSELFRSEAVWTPYLEGDRFATKGPWVFSYLRQQQEKSYNKFYNELKTTYESQVFAAAFSKAMAQTSGNIPASNTAALAEVQNQQTVLTARAKQDAQAMVDDLFRYPEPFRWENSQAGLRLSGSLGWWDWGLQYWYGFLRLPSADLDPVTIKANGNHVLVHYDRVHHAGIDMAASLFGIGLRAEAALDATQDWEGNERTVRNSSFAWNLGVDKQWGELNALAEVQQRYILGHGNITHSYDVEKDDAERRTILFARIAQNLFQETFTWKIAAFYGVEDVDAAVSPSLSFHFNDFEASVSGQFYLGRDATGTFSQFYENNFFELKTVYRF